MSSQGEPTSQPASDAFPAPSAAADAGGGGGVELSPLNNNNNNGGSGKYKYSDNDDNADDDKEPAASTSPKKAAASPKTAAAAPAAAGADGGDGGEDADDEADEAITLAPAEPEETALEAAKRKEKEEQERKEAEMSLAVPISALFRFADGRDKLMMAVGTFGAIIAGCLFPAFSIVFGELMDTLNKSTDFMGDVETLACVFLYFGVAMCVGSYLSVSLYLTAAERQSRRVREAYLAALLRQEPGWHDVQSTGDLSVKLTSETRKLQDGIGDKFAQVVQQVSCFIFAFGIALYTGWELTLVVLATLPVLVICGAAMMFVMAESSADEQKNDGEAGAIAGEALGAVRTVASMQLEPSLSARYAAKVRTAFDAAVRKGWFQGAGMGSFMLAMMSIYGFGLWYGSKLIYDGKDRWPGHAYTGGNVLTIFYALIMGSMGISQAAPHMAAIAMARVAARPLFEVIDRRSRIDPIDKTRGVSLASVTGKIRFEGVQFTYPARLESTVLPSLDLTIEAGTTVAFVGASGSGKSTVLQLVSRYYDPDARRITRQMLRRAQWEKDARDGKIPLRDVVAARRAREARRNAKKAARIEAGTYVPPNEEDGAELTDDYTEDEADGAGAGAGAGGQHEEDEDGNPVAPAAAAAAAAAEEEETPFVRGRVFVEAVPKPAAGAGAGAGAPVELDMRSVNVSSWRSFLGVVGQEPVLFSGTVRDNIVYGCPGATDAQVEAAARAANAHGFIAKMRNGYHTNVGQGGRLLSGGQKQRVAIARALVRDPSILLLDEATSALDTVSERVVQAALDKLLAQGQDGAAGKRRTTLVVAHRLSTIQNADRIVVMDAGRVVEDGTHAQLIAKGGAYAAMVRAQEGETPAAGAGAGAAGADDDDVVKDEEEVAGAGAGAGAASPGETGNGYTTITVKDASNINTSTSAVDSEHDAFAHGKPGDASTDTSTTKKRSGMPGFMLYAKEEWLRLSIGVICGFGDGAAMPLYSLLMGTMTASFYDPDPSAMMDTTRLYAVWFFLLGLGACACVIGRAGFLSLAGEIITEKIKTRLFAHSLRQEMGWHDEERNAAGVLSTKLSADVLHIRSLITVRLSLFASVIANVCAGFIIAFIAGWRLGLVMLAIFPALAGAGVLQFMFMAGFGSKSKSAIEKAGQLATEAVANIRTVLAFGGEQALLSRFEVALEDAVAIGSKSAQVAGLGFGGANFIVFAAYALCFWYGGTLVYEGTMSFEKMLRAFLAIEMSAMMVGQLFAIIPDFEKVHAAVADIFEILDKQSTLDPLGMEGSTPTPGAGELSLSGVHFHYPTRPDVKVLKGLTLTAPARKTLAVVGESGCGKSTLFALLQRFYDPVRDGAGDDAGAGAGAISLDGVDIRSLRISHLRRQIGVVGQEPVLFSGTVADNVRCGDDTITQADIEAACRLANVHELVMRFPQGYNTPVGAKGAQLSGGQKQRVAIARALARKPSILLLDEATSALDSKSERLVQAALTRAMAGRTTLVIAHRLDTVKHADAIVVLHEGKVAEGPATHAELLARGGRYAALVKAASLSGGILDAPAAGAGAGAGAEKKVEVQ